MINPIIFYRISKNSKKVVLEIKHSKIALVQIATKTLDAECLLYTEHPLTKTTFENISIPYFNEAKELVCQVAKYVPRLRLIGWDVSISDSGPVLIEGNSFYDMAGGDLAYGGYLRNPVFRKALHEMNYFNKK